MHTTQLPLYFYVVDFVNSLFSCYIVPRVGCSWIVTADRKTRYDHYISLVLYNESLNEKKKCTWTSGKKNKISAIFAHSKLRKRLLKLK